MKGQFLLTKNNEYKSTSCSLQLMYISNEHELTGLQFGSVVGDYLYSIIGFFYIFDIL